MARASSWQRRAIAPALIVLAVLVANAVYLVGRGDPDPLGSRSDLAVSTARGRLPGERSIDPNDGFITQAVGRQAARQLVHGHLPFWNQFEGAGWPLLASAQAAPLFPPTLLHLLPDGLFFEGLVLEMTAGLATYFLLRRLRVCEAAAIAAGIAFGLNGTLAWLQNGAMLPVAFLPLILLGIERAWARTRTHQGGGWITIAGGVALALYAGFLETVYIFGLLCAAWAVWRVVNTERRDRSRFIRKLAAGGGAGLLLAAPVLVPFVEYLGVADVGGHAGVFSNYTLPHQAFATVLGLPYALGPLFAFDDPAHAIPSVWGSVGGFVSAAIVVLALVGVLGRRDRALRLVLGGWIVFCVLKTFGPHVFLDVVNVLPGMDSVAFYRYMPASLELAAVVLAAFGLDDLASGRVDRRRVVAAAVGAVVAFGVALLTARGAVDAAPGAEKYLVGSFVWALVVLAVVVAGVLAFSGFRLALLLAVLVAVDAVAMFALPTLSAPRDVQVETAPPDWLAHHDGLQRFFSFGPIRSNYGSYYDLASASVTDVPIPQRWNDWMHRELGNDVDVANLPNLATGLAAVTAHPSTLQKLAVRYVVVPAGYHVGAPLSNELTRVYRDRVAEIYRLRGARPYYDVSRGGCSVQQQERETVRIRCAHATTLVRRELYFPGWHATVNGDGSGVHVYDGLFQSVRVPAGTSVVEFSYEPPRWVLAVAAWCAGVVWIAVVLVLRGRARQRRRNADARARRRSPTT